MPTISVIVPVYKVEKYLHRCINSILNQSYKDFELILIDDGSPDNCGTLCDEYAAKDSRIHVIHKENGGLSSARNAGIDWVFENSDSAYLTFIDSDDWVHREYLETLYSISSKYENVATSCLYEVCQESTPADKPIEKIKYKLYSFDDFFSLDLFNFNAVIACGKLYPKKSFKHRYPLGKINEDLYTTHKILFDCDKIALTHIKLYNYYVSSESIMRSRWTKKRLDEIDAAKELIEFMKQNASKKCIRAAEARFLAILYYQLVEMKKDGADFDEKIYEEFKATLKTGLIKHYIHLNDYIFFRATPLVFSKPLAIILLIPRLLISKPLSFIRRLPIKIKKLIILIFKNEKI